MNRREALRLAAAGATLLALPGGAATAAWSSAPETAADGRKTVILTDMAACLPKSAQASRLTPGKWRRYTYEAGPYKGTLLWSPSTNEPAKVTLPLGAKGWHRVYAGIYAAIGPTVTLFRFTKEPAFIARAAANAGRIVEVPLASWDLTGQDLEIAQRIGGDKPAASLAYVRLEPIPEADGRRESAMGRGLTATIDGFTYFHSRAPQTALDLWEEAWYFKESDVDQLILQIGGADTTNYPTKIGTMFGQGQALFPRPGDGYVAESCAALARQGVNPTAEMIKAAHALGIETLIGCRPAAWDLPGAYNDFFVSPFFTAHPEWRTVDRDGTAVLRLSYAYPEVRKHMVDVLREAVGFGADGVSVMFNRGTPMVLFEKPFTEAFRAKYGADPATLPDDDPRVLDLRAAFVTQFMRDVRAMLDEEGRKRGDGRRLKLAAIALMNGQINRYYGVDVPGWVNAGLLDSVVVWDQAPNIPGVKGTVDLAYYRSVCAAKNVPFRTSRRTYQMAADPKANAQSFADDFVAGADGVLLWDANYIDDPRVWRAAARSGTPAGTQAVLEDPPPPARTYTPLKLDGVSMSGIRFGPGQGF